MQKYPNNRNLISFGEAMAFVGKTAHRFFLDRIRVGPRHAAPHSGFALISQVRCGSTVLGLLLHQNPRIYWDGEALRPGRVPNRWLRRLQGAKGLSGLRDLQALMPYARGRTYAFSTTGQRLRYASIQDMLNDLIALGFDRFAILERRNKLRKLVSNVVARQHGLWHLSRGGTAHLNSVRVPVTFERGETLAQRLDAIQGRYEEARKYLGNLEVLNLVYETDIQQDPLVAYRAVCEYLDIEATAARIKTERLNPFTLDQIVSNYDEIKAALRGTAYEWMTAE